MSMFLGLLAFVFMILFAFVTTFYFQDKNKVKDAHEEISRIKRKAKSALDRYKSISDLEEYKAELSSSIEERKENVNELCNIEAGWKEKIASQESILAKLVSDSESVEETLDMQSFGLYRTKYGFETSERYAHQLDEIRSDQKQMVKLDEATHCPADWTVEGSAAKGKKMIKEQAKLMLRAFNGECDSAVSKAKYNNMNNLENRINRSFDTINKLGESKKLWITREYLKQKLQELYLVHEHRVKVEEEKQEQQRIKEQMREEEKALREIEKAKKNAEKDEEIKANALEKARQELAETHGKQNDRLQLLVDKLELELKEATERKARAISRAQQTRSGHVYVLSNIGSFGENVYKIGMTRRLEPLDRVKELGDASVPFRFDVHAMIYSEDAPALENTLHKYFNDRRVNMANLRKEYFSVNLDEIQIAVEKNFGVITFVAVPEAEEYRQTLAMQNENGQVEENLALT